MNNKRQIQMDYVPHGIPHKKFKQIDKNDKEYKKFIDEYYGAEYENYDFIVLYNNRNIKRKLTSDVMHSFKLFTDKLTKKQKEKTLLILHTHISDMAGTDLNAVYNDLFSDINIKFSEKKLSEQGIIYLYNSVDLTINLANNEGYGLATAESLMTGTPIIATVTGGLQDQMGFEGILNQEYYNKKDKPKCGDWVYPCWPKIRTLQGSPPTPYIFADYPDVYDVANGLYWWYKMDSKERVERGLKGREYLIENGHTLDNMIDSFLNNFDELLENWQPRQKLHLVKC